MDKLAAKTNGAITKQSLSKYEAGVMCPKRGTLAALAKALDIGEAFFSGADLVDRYPYAAQDIRRSSLRCGDRPP